MKLLVILMVLAAAIRWPGGFVWANYIDAVDRQYSEAESRAERVHLDEHLAAATGFDTVGVAVR